MDLTPLIQPADTKILLVVMDGLGGYADADHGTELEEAATPHLDARARGHRRPGRAGRPRHHARLGPGPPRPLRLRPRAVRARARRAVGGGPRLRAARRRRRRPRQPRHPRRRRHHHRPARRAASPIPRRVPSSIDSSVRCTSRASRCSSVTSASTGCSSCCAAPGSILGSPTPTRSTPASPPLAVEPSTPRRSAPPTWSPSSTRRSGGARRPRQGERRAAARLRHPSRAPRASPSASACARPRSRSTRCTAASPGCSAWTCSAARPISTNSSRSCGARGTTTTTSSCTTSTPTPPAKTATAPARSPPSRPSTRWSPSCARSARRDRGERRPLHAVADGRALVAPGAHVAVERALRARRRRAVRRTLVPAGRLGIRPTKDLMAFMLANAGRLAKYGACSPPRGCVTLTRAVAAERAQPRVAW